MMIRTAPTVVAAVLVALQLVLALALASSAAGQQQPGHDRFTGRRVTVEVFPADKPDKPFKLRLPRFLPAPSPAGGFRRSFNDTCGMFDVVVGAFIPAGWGPQPHLHYAQDEWFFTVGTGKVRMFSAQKAKKYIPGQLPGMNVPAGKMGSVVISPGAVLRSPKGHIHYFVTETNVTEFINVHVNGFMFERVLEASNTITDPAQMLRETTLYGVPTDATGVFVGLEGPPESVRYRQARGPVDVPSAQLKRLQRLFDEGDKCYPAAAGKQ